MGGKARRAPHVRLTERAASTALSNLYDVGIGEALWQRANARWWRQDLIPWEDAVAACIRVTSARRGR